MATDLIEIDVENPYGGAIDRAVQEIARGHVVGVPTDALYMLVADPLNLQAVGRVFAAKGRENVRSLPLAVSDILMAEDLAKELNSRFYILARHFWPGPLTIIVPARCKSPAKGDGEHWPIGHATGELQGAERDRRKDWPCAHCNQREHVRPAHGIERHRAIRRDGWTARSGTRWRRLHWSWLDHD